MAKNILVIESDDQAQFFLSLAAGTMALGDNPSRPELLLRDLRVLRIHCEVEIDQDSVVLNKLAGAAGQPGVQREIQPGQDARFGHTRLLLKATVEEKVQEKAATPGGAEATFKRLRVIDGDDLGRAFRLPAEAGTVSIGKNPRQADVVLHDLYVSKVHCVVEIAGGKVLVRHNEGDNGTLINNKRITGQQELHVGDVLRVGNSQLRLETASTLGGAEVKPSPEQQAPAADDEEPETIEEEPAAPEEPPHPFVGKVFGNYHVMGLIGHGHSGDVFRARDTRNNLVVALKVLSPTFPADGQELQKFVQGLKVATQQHHANLVTIHGAGRSGPHCWFAREYVDGESVASLAKRFGQKGKIAWPRACAVAVHLARALGFLHQNRLTHGNVTPANVLIGQDKVTRLADLGLDKALEGSKLAQSIAEKKKLTELPFMAPERTDPKAFVDNLADLYSLGAVVYLLLTGRPPFSGDSAEDLIEEVRRTPVTRPTTYQKEIPPAFEAIVMRLLAKLQEDRFPTAAELLTSLEAITEEHKIEA